HLWSTDWSSVEAWATTPAITPKTVFFEVVKASGSSVWAFRANRAPHGLPKVRWASSGASSASLANNVVYTACSGSPCALNAKTGAVLWQGSGAFNVGVPIVVNGTVYGACNGSSVCAWSIPSKAHES